MAETQEEKFSFPPGSSLPKPKTKPTPEPEYWPSSTTPAYDPSSHGIKISLATEVLAERCTRHIYRSGSKGQPTNTYPPHFMHALGVDYEHPENGNNIIIMELSADRTQITIKRMQPPPGMTQPVDANIFAVDSDGAAQAAEEKEKI
jgi:hypothetical protein